MVASARLKSCVTSGKTTILALMISTTRSSTTAAATAATAGYAAMRPPRGQRVQKSSPRWPYGGTLGGYHGGGCGCCCEYDHWHLDRNIDRNLR